MTKEGALREQEQILLTDQSTTIGTLVDGTGCMRELKFKFLNRSIPVFPDHKNSQTKEKDVF